MRVRGRTRSKMNPNMCNHCERYAEEHPGGAERVHLDGEGRVGDDIVHIRDRREMEDHVRTGERGGEAVGVEDVDRDPFRVRAMRRLGVEDTNGAARIEQRVDDVRADEA